MQGENSNFRRKVEDKRLDKIREAQVLTTGDIAKLFHVAPRTVAKWVDAGLLKCHYMPKVTRLQGNTPGRGQDRRIPRAEVIRFAKERGIAIPSLCEKRLILVSSSYREATHSLSQELGEDWEVGVCKDISQLARVMMSSEPEAIFVDLPHYEVLSLLREMAKELPHAPDVIALLHEDVEEQLFFQPYVRMPCAPGAVASALKQLDVR
jgi:hypothetical protein